MFSSKPQALASNTFPVGRSYEVVYFFQIFLWKRFFVTAIKIQLQLTSYESLFNWNKQILSNTVYLPTGKQYKGFFSALVKWVKNPFIQLISSNIQVHFSELAEKD